MVYLISYLIGWFVGIVFYFLHPSDGIVQNFTLGHLVFTVGFFGLFNFLGHAILGEKVAAQIGWVSNGFQKELGWFSLGTGISGILCYWFRGQFWWATVIPFSTFLLGAAVLHIVEMLKEKNFNPGNTWIVLPDILMPLTLIILLSIR